MLIGIVGKPSSGKSTFLNACCLAGAKTGNYPFTTIDPNLGSGFTRVKCICKEVGVEDNPKNSTCVNGNRYIPVKLLDVAGLVPDAHLGKGLGNKFLTDLSRADVLIHVLDISGELDLEGNEIDEKNHDPMEDIKFLEREIDLWFKDILLRKDWVKFTNSVIMEKLNFTDVLFERLSGIIPKKVHILNALSNMDNKKVNEWNEEEIEKFASLLRKEAKPILIVANKIDKKTSLDNFNRLKSELKERIISTSSLAEFVLRNFAESGTISYYPGDSSFKILKEDDLSDTDKNTLKMIEEKILKPFGSTGIQEAINVATFEVLNNIVVYPVHDENKLTDKDGNVLPDAFIIPEKMGLKQFVKDKIHSDLAKHFLYGIDGRTKMRLGEVHSIKNNNLIKILSAARNK